MKKLILWLSFLVITFSFNWAVAATPAAALKHRATLTREAQFVFGLNAPVAMFAAQIEQESSWRESVTTWDNGRGLAQFMDPTTDHITKLYPELGKADPYNPRWAMRALVRYDQWLVARVKGKDDCHRWAAALKGYNAGLGYVQQAQRKSPDPQTWFGVTEFVPTKQSAKNFEYSRKYPHWILFKRQSNYPGWGVKMCGGGPE